jgi:hypothetical protein
MSVRPVEAAALAVAANSSDLVYDVRWYDDTESVVPLWWLGVWVRGTDHLVHTEILQGPRSMSRRDLYDWLARTAPAPIASRLATEAVAGARSYPS